MLVLGLQKQVSLSLLSRSRRARVLSNEKHIADLMKKCSEFIRFSTKFFTEKTAKQKTSDNEDNSKEDNANDEKIKLMSRIT